MPYSLENRLVVGLASSALFDPAESDAVLRQEGEQAYRDYQELHLEDRLNPGAAFPFIQRLLSLNDPSKADDPLIEVIVLSRNDPDTGLRVMNSIETYGLPITRAINDRSLSLLGEFHARHSEEIPGLSKQYTTLSFGGAYSNRPLPLAKVIDMYGFQRGFKASCRALLAHG